MKGIFAKKAESDNITIFICTLLFLVGCFYAADWFMGGALSDVTGSIYQKTVDTIKSPISSFISKSDELPPACKEEFVCDQPGNETACASQLNEYNEICEIN